MMTYSESRPPLGLAAWVASFWTFSVAPGAGAIEHHIPLTGGVMLSVAEGGELVLAGPRIDPLTTTVRGGEMYHGIHFVPGAASTLLGVPAARLRDLVAPARFVLEPRLVSELQAPNLADPFGHWSAVLERRAREASPGNAAVQLAVALIAHSRGAAPVASIAREVGISPRRLRGLFAEHAGLTPKELARVIRLRATAADSVLRGESWIDLAAGQGFADQPHLVREFRSILGVTPVEFEQHARRIAHRLV